MIYAQFFQRPATYAHDGKPWLIEACGDRSVVIIDARLNPKTIGRIAATECAKRGYVAWQIFKGDAFTRSKPVSPIWSLPDINGIVAAYPGTFPQD